MLDSRNLAYVFSCISAQKSGPLDFARKKQSFFLSLCLDRTISNAKIKTVKLTVVVVLGHLFCSVPYVFIQLYTVWGNPTHQESEYVYCTYSRRLGCVNSATWFPLAGHLGGFTQLSLRFFISKS